MSEPTFTRYQPEPAWSEKIRARVDEVAGTLADESIRGTSILTRLDAIESTLAQILLLLTKVTPTLPRTP